MQISAATHSPRPVRPPPLWFVTNGELTVGPVRTDLLQRGVFHGRIPEDCLVRELTWRTWRRLDQIREIRAVQRVPGTDTLINRPFMGQSHADLVSRFGLAMDAAEVLSLALHECFETTNASFGLVHRAFDPDQRATTTCVRGIGMTGRLGAILPDDAATRIARFGGLVVARPGTGEAERCIANRLGAAADLEGVAMVPLCIGGDLLAIIELGRVGHAFRASDVTALERIASAATLVIYGC
ncbi:MAG: GAF domain-containing protein [Myxococcales bacterium]|nr:GAF domain-containing protein [Myxococcales bacterium]